MAGPSRGRHKDEQSFVNILRPDRSWPPEVTKGKDYVKDIFRELGDIFGFQDGNVENQKEHLILLFANSLCGLADENPSPCDEAYRSRVCGVCDKMMKNYTEWCSYMGKDSVYKEKGELVKSVELVALYLCIWGEAANVRFLPECICFIFHRMAEELKKHRDTRREPGDFLEEIIKPIYDAIKEEKEMIQPGKTSHSKWRNYDDFNEYFWTKACFKVSLGKGAYFKDAEWHVNEGSPFFNNKDPGNKIMNRSFGKTYFVEHRTFLHLYHSFARVWILLFMMFQCLAVLAHVLNSSFSIKTVKLFLSLGPTYFLMKFMESLLDVILLYGAYRRTPFTATLRRFLHLLFFGGCTGSIIYIYLKLMFEGSSSLFYFRINLFVLGSYVTLSLIISFLLHPIFCQSFFAWSDRFPFTQMLKWLHQDHYFVGNNMHEQFRYYIRYILFWVILLVCKFTFSYFFQIKPLMDATPAITSYGGEITYMWHDFVSKNNHNALTVFFLWAPITLIYLVDIVMWYAVFSAIVGGILGAKDRLGEIRTLELLRRRFKTFPKCFVQNLQHEKTARASNDRKTDDESDAAKRFEPYWNKIISLLREEDYLSNREVELLTIPQPPKQDEDYFWHPLFLLVGKVSIATALAADSHLDRVKDDPYMNAAVNEVLVSGRALIVEMASTFDCKCFDQSPSEENRKRQGSQKFDFSNADKAKEFVHFVDELKQLIEVVSSNSKGERLWKALNDLHGRLHSLTDKRKPVDIESGDIKSAELLKMESYKRLRSLLTMEAVSNIPKNVEAQRRLQFFTNSLFMDFPKAPSVRAMRSFSVLTPYYKEPVLFSKDELSKENEDGITILFYLKKVFPDEWNNFLERIKLVDSGVMKLLEHDGDKRLNVEDVLKPDTILKLRLWASYRGQTLARTVRGMMYYESALELQNKNDKKDSEPIAIYSDLKFTYVVSCQIFGKQLAENNPEAEDICFLMEKYESLRVAYVHEDNSNGATKYYSKLVKTDSKDPKADPKDPKKQQTIYSIELPGDPILGEGKPENQNHAVIFTRGDALQTIDMNQDNYFEEALKMRNLLEEFSVGSWKPTILGVREHVFTGSVSSLAWFMSNQEQSFVTLGQRVLARPLRVRMHYGHPDVFDRVFHLTRGGFSKASKAINVSEDIYAGFNSTLRGGNVTHHEFIQVGKGRDIGLNQIALFEAKVSSGNGEQSLSRDVYRLARLLDFFRMLSFFVTSVGYYFCTLMMLWAVYIFLYGRAYLALSGVEKTFETLADESRNTALQSSLDAQFLFQIGTFTAIPMLAVFILEQGVLKACIHFITMHLQLCPVFFTFSLGTRAHYFGRTILHGGAKYRETGRSFVVKHIMFAENYRLYSRSHFVKALEIIMLLVVYLVYRDAKSTVSYVLLSFSSWFLAISWLYAPFIFNPSGFEWQKTVDDFNDWTKWLSGGVGIKENESWVTWWEEQEAVGTLGGEILETVLSLRFLFFQYGVIYHLHVVGTNTSLWVYGASWLLFLLVVVVIKIYSITVVSAKCRMPFRMFRFLFFLLIASGLAAAVVFTEVTVGDIFASLLALLPTGWGLVRICVAWKRYVMILHMWPFVRSVARFYDMAMGAAIFFPVAVLSWFPFVSTFQTRLLFNQAFSRGLEISLILAGGNKKVISTNTRGY